MAELKHSENQLKMKAGEQGRNRDLVLVLEGETQQRLNGIARHVVADAAAAAGGVNADVDAESAMYLFDMNYVWSPTLPILLQRWQKALLVASHESGARAEAEPLNIICFISKWRNNTAHTLHAASQVKKIIFDFQNLKNTFF